MSKQAIVVLSIGKEFEDILKITKPYLLKYAKKTNSKLIFLCTRGKFTDLFNEKFEKFQIYDLLDEYDRVLYLDSDIIIHPESPNVFDIVPEDEIGAVYDNSINEYITHSRFINSAQEANGNINWNKGYINSGVFLVSKIHRDVFDPETVAKWNLVEGNDQTLINYNIHKNGFFPIHKLDVKFNAMEINGFTAKKINKMKKEFIRTTIQPLGNNKTDGYFMHFAGVFHPEQYQEIKETSEKLMIKNNTQKFNGYLIIYYYKSIVDGVMTSLIDAFYNIKKSQKATMKIICPELYLLDKKDYYDFPLNETQWHEYINEIGIKSIPYEGEFNTEKFRKKLVNNQLTTSIPFLRFNRNFGNINLFNCIDMENNSFKSDTIVCSARLIYEILMGADIELKCNNLIVLDSLDTFKSKIGLFPDFDDLFSTMFKNSNVTQLSNPANFRDSKYRQLEYYHKFSRKRLQSLEQTGMIKDEYIFNRTRKEKTKIGDGHFENVGKGMFEHLWFNKKVIYKTDGMFTKDGLYYYMKLFGLDAKKDQEITLSRMKIKNKLFQRKNFTYDMLTGRLGGR